jgi:Cu/Ag efflux pump CusA
MIRARGFQNDRHFRAIPVLVSETGTPVLLQDVARVQVNGDAGVMPELDGEGEAGARLS